MACAPDPQQLQAEVTRLSERVSEALEQVRRRKGELEERFALSGLKDPAAISAAAAALPAQTRARLEETFGRVPSPLPPSADSPSAPAPARKFRRMV